jgi:hypothetical protein
MASSGHGDLAKRYADACTLEVTSILTNGFLFNTALSRNIEGTNKILNNCFGWGLAEPVVVSQFGGICIRRSICPPYRFKRQSRTTRKSLIDTNTNTNNMRSLCVSHLTYRQKTTSANAATHPM